MSGINLEHSPRVRWLLEVGQQCGRGTDRFPLVDLVQFDETGGIVLETDQFGDRVQREVHHSGILRKAEQGMEKRLEHRPLAALCPPLNDSGWACYALPRSRISPPTLYDRFQ